MGDFNFVSIKFQSFSSVNILKNSSYFFHKCSLENLLSSFSKIFQCFLCFNSMHFFLFRKMDLLSRMTNCLFYVSNAEQ